MSTQRRSTRPKRISSTQLFDIPQELFFYILGFLPPSALSTMAKVNKTCSQEFRARLSTLRALTESPYIPISVILGEVRVAEFRSCRLGNVGITTLAQAIMPVSKGGSGALASIKELYLNSNKFGDEGVKALADAAAGGAMAHLEVSSLHAP